jgi:hypothetical protein
MRRGFVALALLVIVALSIGGFIQYLAIDAVKDQTQVLEDRSEIERGLLTELQMEGEERDALISLLRRRFRRADHRGVKGHNLIIEALDRILDLAGIELDPPLERVGQRRNGGGGAGGGGNGGESPPPSPSPQPPASPPPTVGNSNQCPPKNPHC